MLLNCLRSLRRLTVAETYLRIPQIASRKVHLLHDKLYRWMHPDAPWITPQAIVFLDEYLRPFMHGFEWGSGRSTAYFAKRLEHLTSVEHDTGWHRSVRRQLDHMGIPNVDLRLIQPIPPDAMPEVNWRADFPGYKVMKKPPQRPEFLDYFNAINPVRDESLDIVMVDGRAREACIVNAIPKIRSGGLLVLDNSDRPRYGEACAFLRTWNNVHTTNKLWSTDIWIKQ